MKTWMSVTIAFVAIVYTIGPAIAWAIGRFVD
jgi:hypothetical protein